MAKILTAASAAKLRPVKDRVLEIPDGQAAGLYLLIHPSNKKVWALRYRRPRDDRPAKLTLGTVFIAGDGSEPDTAPVIGGHLGLSGARRLVAELKHEIRLGRDPGAAHIAKKKNTSFDDDAFGAAARDFIAGHAMKKTRRWQGTARLIGLQPAEDDTLKVIPGSLCGRWQKLPVSEISEDMIYHVIEDARRKGIPGLKRRNTGESEPRARSLHSALSVLFGWLKSKRRIKVNPMAALDSPAAPSARDRVLTDDEIKRLWTTCDVEGYPFGPILKLLLLTGCRLNEVAGLRWSELDDGLTTLSLPGERTKNRKPHVVPLVQASRAVLEGIDTHGDLVFTTNGKTPVSGWSKLKRRLDKATKIPNWRLHDLRRTCATGMAGPCKIPPHIVEAALNHISGAKAGVAGTYNRAEYLPERKAALERWASHIEGLVSGRPAKVIAMKRAKR